MPCVPLWAHQLSHVYIQLCCGKVVQKEHWLSTRGDDVIHTHSHQVYANGVMRLHVKGQFQLGTHTVCASYQI